MNVFKAFRITAERETEEHVCKLANVNANDTLRAFDVAIVSADICTVAATLWSSKARSNGSSSDTKHTIDKRTCMLKRVKFRNKNVMLGCVSSRNCVMHNNVYSLMFFDAFVDKLSNTRLGCNSSGHPSVHL